MTISHVMACVHCRHWETTERTEVGVGNVWWDVSGMSIIHLFRI